MDGDQSSNHLGDSGEGVFVDMSKHVPFARIENLS